jgi:hypothetical protein
VRRDVYYFLLRVPALAQNRNVRYITARRYVFHLEIFNLRQRKGTLEVYCLVARE